MMCTFNAAGDSECIGVGKQPLLVNYKYSEGSIVYIVEAANKGHIKYVCIKEVRLMCNANTNYKIQPLYVDTVNNLWNEGDLCTEIEARALAVNYLQRERAKILAELARNGETYNP